MESLSTSQMTSVSTLGYRSSGQAVKRSVLLFGLVAISIAAGAAFLAGWAPLGLSIIAVFLFAGPHNWMEVRFFISQMPARWGPLRSFFMLGIGGAMGLTLYFAAMPVLARSTDWSALTWQYHSSIWSSLLVLWIAGLIHLRGKHKRARDWSLAWPIALLSLAVIWMFPQTWDMLLVYLHPLIALWFLDREIARRRPQWKKAYRICLAFVPVCLAALWLQLYDAPALPGGEDALTMRITNHAGAHIWENISPHLLVATHVFLEVLHYGVWIVAIPLISMKSKPWQLDTVPLCRRSNGFKWMVAGIVIIGLILVVSLWGGFIANYAITRDVYFTLAILHVLAEFPFLIFRY